MNTTPTPHSVDPPRNDSNMKIALVAAGSLVVIVAIVSLFVQLAHMRRDMVDTHDSVVAEVAGLRDAFSSSAALQAKQLELLETQLRNARGQVKLRADQLKTEQAQTQQEIRGAKQASEEANANLTNKIGAVSADRWRGEIAMERHPSRIAVDGSLNSRPCKRSWACRAAGLPSMPMSWPP